MEQSRLEDSLRQYWSQYLTTVSRRDKSKYLELFLKEFLKIYSSVGGNAVKMPSFGDIHSVSNMLAREFQTTILAKCQGDEDVLVEYLCKGPGLMLLEVLCILANKIAGCSSELANLLVTILPVLFRIPPNGHDILQGLELVMLEWESYFQDPKAKPHHSITTQKMILEHCDRRFASPASSTHKASLLDSEEKTLTSKQDATISCGLVLPLKESTDSSSVADESDILTSLSSVSSMGSIGILSSNPSDSSSPHESIVVQLHRQSSGISSLVESTETPITAYQAPESSASTQEAVPKILVTKEAVESIHHLDGAEESQDVSINTFELLNLTLSVLENLCCRDVSSCDTTLTMKTAGQLIDIIVCMKDEQTKDVNTEEFEDIYCTWDISSSIAAQLSMLRTAFFFLYTTFRNPKSAKQLVRSSYVKNLVALVENAVSNATFTAVQLEELAEEIEHLSPKLPSGCQSECLVKSALCKRFHSVLFFSYSLQGLLSYLCSSLQFGTLINSSLLALSRELLDQFALNDGFEHVISAVLKMEDMMVTSSGVRKGPGSESIVIPPIPQAIRDVPNVSIFHMLSVIGKVISLVKKGKSYCRGEVEIPTRRKSEESYLMFQPPVDLMTSDVEESSESAGDMEMENDKRSRSLGDQCQILIPVTSLLTIFKASKTQYLSCQIITCLGKVGVCSCIKPDDLISPLLTRFFHRPRLLQTQILRLINQLVLTALDDPFVTPKPQEAQSNTQNTSRTRTKKTYSKSPTKSSPVRGNGGTWGEMLARSPRHVSRIPQESPSWSCLSQYCSLLTSGDSVLAFETAKSLKPLVALGSANLKDELFRIVLLPSIFRFDSRRKKSSTSTLQSGFPSVQVDYPNKLTDLPESTGLASETISVPEERRTRSQSSSSNLTKDVLRLLLGYLPSLLVSSSSKELFFSCGGLTQLQVFLEEEELQQLVIEVFEFLASLEDRSKSVEKVKTVKSKDEELEYEEKESTSKEELATAIHAFLTLLRFTAKIELSGSKTETVTNAAQESTQEDNSETEVNKNASSSNKEMSGNYDQDSIRPLANLTLRYHVWKACLNLLVSNRLFVDLFVADNGPRYSFELLEWLFRYLAGDSRNDKDYSDAVTLFEVVLAVCIRMAYAGFWKYNEGISSIDSLLSEAEQTVLNSSALKATLGRGLCDSFTKVSVKTLFYSQGFTQQDGSEVIETSCLFNQGGACETEAADWSQLMIDDDMDGPINNKSNSQEDGYEADNEVNSDSSDDTADKVVRQTSQPRKTRDRRKSEESRDNSARFHGLVIYPQICQFLFRLLNAAYGPEACSKTGKSLSVLTHAVQCLLGLVKDCEHNCRVLCQEGLVSSILKCYQDVLRSNDESIRELQSIVLDLFVHLANHQIRASELKDFVAIFKTKSVPVDLLCNSLSHIASKASFTHGPAYLLSFPCRLQTVDPRSKHGGRKAKAQRLRQDLIKRSKGVALLQSGGDASSEGASTEGKYSPERSRRSKPQSKLARGGPVETHRRLVNQRTESFPAPGDKQDIQRSESSPGDDSADLPSPFSVKAINLRCHGIQTWPPPDFSIVFWIRLHNMRRFSESEPGMPKDATRLRGMSMSSVHGTRSSRSMSCPNVWTRGTDAPSCEEAIHICSLGSRKSLFEIWVLPSGGSLLFRWTRATKGGTDGYDIVKELVTRLPGLSRGRWHHMVVSFSQSKQRYIPPDCCTEMKEYDDACKILSIIDGTEATEHNFGPPLPLHEEGKCTLLTCLLGHVTLSTTKREGHGAEKSVLPEGYDLGNLLAFVGVTSSKSVKKGAATRGDWVIGKDEAFYLYSLGPNYNSIGHLHTDFTLLSKDLDGSSQPFLVASRLWSRLSITERSVSAELSTGFLRSPHVVIPDLEMSLKSKLLLSYSPVHHKVFNQNIRIPVTDDKTRRTSHHDVTNKPTVKTNLTQNEAKLFLEVEALRVSTFLEAAHDVGGMTVFIYLFAKVVEMTSDHKTQADALSVVLSLQKTCEYHARAMDEESGYALLKRILLSPQCMIGYHVLKVLMEAACDGEVFKHTNLSDNPIMLNIDSNAVVRNVDIFQHYLLNRKIWDKAKQGVLEMLLSTLEILVHASHPHYMFNIAQFQKAELVQQLLIGCQERQGEGLKEIPSTISTLYVNIIQNVMGQTPDLTVLKAVCEFLIAIHPTEDTTSLHSPNRFYLMEYNFDFGYPTPAVTRQPLSPSSFQSGSLLPVKKQSSLSSPHDNTLVEAKPTHSDVTSPENLETADSAVRRGRNGTLIAEVKKEGKKERIEGSIFEQKEKNNEEEECIKELSGQKVDNYAVTEEQSTDLGADSFEFPAQSSPQAIDPQFASCPPPSLHRKLTVPIPNRPAASSVKPCVGSADGGSILLQGSPLREWKTSVSSPSTPQSPLTPQTPQTPQTPVGSYMGPGSKPMSIAAYSTTPQSRMSSVDVMEYDFINESDFSSLKSSLAHQSSMDDYLVVEGYPGIKSSTQTYKPNNNSEKRRRAPDHMTKMRLGLLKLLQKVLLNLQAEQVPAVIGGVLKAEYLLVWVSHQSDSVRELVIKILCLYLQKSEPERYKHFLGIHGFHLLANQLYDHSVTKGTIEACLWLMVGRPVDLDKDYAYSTTFDQNLPSTLRPLGVVPLLSILENTLIFQHLNRMLIKHLCHLFLKIDELCLNAVDHGLLQTVCNVVCGLARLQHQQSQGRTPITVDVGCLMDDLQTLLSCIVIKACSTCGRLYFQMFEDLLVVLENLEELDHRKREYGLSIFFIARYLRYFAIQVALYFFQEICKDEIPIGGRKRSGIRLFRGSEKSSDINTFKPVSSWIPLSPDHNLPCSDLGFLKSSPTIANSNEQTQRFQSVVQMAVNCVTYSRTVFLNNDLGPLQVYTADLQVHEALRPGIVKGTTNGVNMEKEFAQFIFSLLFEFLDTCLNNKGTMPSKVMSKDIIKPQLGKLMVYLLSPSQALDLSCFVVQISDHVRAKKLVHAVLSSNGGGKLRDKIQVYLPKLLSMERLSEDQRSNALSFRSLLESCGLRFAALNVSSETDVETQSWDHAETTNIMEWQKKRQEAFTVISKRIKALNSKVSESAKIVTRVAVEIQDTQRQTLLKHNRDGLSAEVQIRKKWRQVIERLIHERSIWYDQEYFPVSWRLDPTEGPLRVRCRMQRCHLDVPQKYVMEDHQTHCTAQGGSPLAYLFEDSTSCHKKNVYYIFDTPDTIRFLYHCMHILLDIKTKGVILIGEIHMYFIGEEATTADTDVTQILLGNKDAISISWAINEIQEIRTRRYCLKDIGMEIFLSNGRTYLLAFDSEKDREIVIEAFKQRGLPIYEVPISENLNAITTKWRTGNLSNFEYLTELNKMAGRTFNDLMQYPVFPFILSDFTSEVLDLNDNKVFRELSKPIAAQSLNKELSYKERYRWLKEEYERSEQNDTLLAPYHYGSHYSNSGTVLHFLVRLPPFTKMFLQYQDKSFDIPDRTFHSMATTWRLSSYESSTDVKELIPEFFFLPQFLDNFEGFDFGLRQNGERVMNVTLPPWAKGNPRLFILIHRQALETEYVSRYIHSWIDLVFGYKQTGQEAVEAVNVFHPATYYGVRVSSITDPVRQKALKTMIETYGQTPRQLFNYPHSPRLTRKTSTSPAEFGSMTSLNTSKFDFEVASATNLFMNRFAGSFSSENTLSGSVTDTLVDAPKPVTTVEGLRWGNYVCSPALPVPFISFNQAIGFPVSSLVCNRGEVVHVLCQDTTLMSGYEQYPEERGERLVLSAALSWSAVDGSLTVFVEGSGSGAWLMDTKTPDKVTCCVTSIGCTSLFIGSSSGALFVLPTKYNPTLDCRIEVLGSRARLYGHTNEITCLKICHEYSILVSGSKDKTAIIWDLNRLSYIRTLEHESAVNVLVISRTSGDIATVSHHESLDQDSVHEEDSILSLWTVNGIPVAQSNCEHTINCMDFSRAPEGVSVNIIATGLSNGAIRLWSTWDLQHIRDIAPEQILFPIASVAFSEDSQRLFALNTQGRLFVWQRKDKIYAGRPPTVVTFPVSDTTPKVSQDKQQITG